MIVTPKQVKSGLLVALAILVEILPRTIYVAVHGAWWGYAAALAILVSVALILKHAAHWHYRSVHASTASQMMASGVFLIAPVCAWLAGWVVWPHMLVSAVFLIQPILIWSTTKPE